MNRRAFFGASILGATCGSSPVALAAPVPSDFRAFRRGDHVRLSNGWDRGEIVGFRPENGTIAVSIHYDLHVASDRIALKEYGRLLSPGGRWYDNRDRLLIVAPTVLTHLYEDEMIGVRRACEAAGPFESYPYQKCSVPTIVTTQKA